MYHLYQDGDLAREFSNYAEVTQYFITLRNEKRYEAAEYGEEWSAEMFDEYVQDVYLLYKLEKVPFV